MRLTPAELTAIREAAAAARQSVSAYMLSAALEKAVALSDASTTAK
jgi:uncharacterized protein (DUF1778 family)